MIVQVIRDILLDSASVTSLVGQRIYPVEFPEGPTFPAIIITKVHEPGQYDMQGDAGIARARIQIDCYAKPYTLAVSVKQAVRAVMSGFPLTSPPPSTSACTIDSCMVENDMDLPVPAFQGGGPRHLRRRMLELIVWHKEI